MNWRDKEVWSQISTVPPKAMFDCGNPRHGLKSTSRNLLLILFGNGTYAFWYKEGGGWHSDSRIYFKNTRGHLPKTDKTDKSIVPWEFPTTPDEEL